MITWAINHAPYVAVLLFGYAGGCVRSAHVQLRRERLEKWLVEQRRINRTADPV